MIPSESPPYNSEAIGQGAFPGSKSDEDFKQMEGSSGNEISFVDTKYLCIGIVDIVNSTKVTADIGNSENVAKYYSIFINTMAVIARNFGGEVIKNVGDSVVFFFPQTSGSSHDSFRDVLRCGLTMSAAHIPMNEKYKDHHLPPVNYRISADYGKIEVAKSGPSRIVDVFGPTVNMCAKMNSKAPLNGLIIGGDLYQIIKGQHETITSSFIIKQMSAYSIGGLNAPAYPLYHVTTQDQLAMPMIVSPNPTKARSRPSTDKGESFNQGEQKLKVMLIDDEPDMIITYKSFLHSEGYSVDAFSNSQEALRHFAQVNPSYYDLIIMDIRMPHLNGLQLYHRMKAINSSVRVLFVSALDAVEELVSILPDIKRNSIIRKPIERDNFVKSVQSAIYQ
jgi:CheY-like chemotaxis protein